MRNLQKTMASSEKNFLVTIILSAIKSGRMVLIGAGLVFVTMITILLGTVSKSVVLLVENDLKAYWRTTYDILVRPANSQSSVEKKYDLLEANYLSQISGGIAFEQYQTIAAIPGIEVAAPVALLTYIQGDLSFASRFPGLDTDGVYLYESILAANNGIKDQEEIITAYYYYGVPPSAPLDNNKILVNQPLYPVGIPVSLALAAIDPAQEAKLVNLEQAVREGKYLTGREPLLVDTLSSPFGDATRVQAVPVLVNTTPYVSFTHLNRLSKVLLPPDVATLDAILSRGGAEYLSALPTDVMTEERIDSSEAYPRLIENLVNPNSPGSETEHYSLEDNSLRPVPRKYQEVAPPLAYDGLALEVMPFSPPEGSSKPGEITFNLKAFGVFDIEKIPPPPDVNRVPLEIYYPPVVALLYDENGQAVTPRPVMPTFYLGPRSYVLSPPLMLTTLEAARAITGDDCARCISAIRVRVALEDCPGDYLTCPLTSQNQRKIETIASEIARLTGLDVDVMVGSSPTSVLVHIPETGYVEEQWIQKNVTAAYKEKVQTGHLLMLGTLLGIGGLFVLDLAWAEAVARRRTIALQKALGWRSSTVFLQILGQIALISLAATVAGTFAAWGLARILEWAMPSPALLWGVPLLVAGLSLVGGTYPAWLAARIPPAVGVRRGQIIYPKRTTSLPASGLLVIAWKGLLRRWSHTALGALTATLSAALFVLMLAVTLDRQGAMSGTLLGEFILVRIEGYHYTIVGLGFGLAALSLANSLLAGVMERRREIGIYKAAGWRTAIVVRLFLYEGALIGALGGLVGAAVGLGVFVGLYETVTLNLAWIGLAGVVLPIAVGLLAAFYPARVAAKVSPAEAVRYE